MEVPQKAQMNDRVYIFPRRINKRHPVIIRSVLAAVVSLPMFSFLLIYDAWVAPITSYPVVELVCLLFLRRFDR